ncbi:MAG: DUF6118 family protein [Acidiphilium sp.]|jgi:hypothetical protein|uniref:DUF6118 family protein n=1 Tax=Acidiphilium acidophilum TaxID=76588 RepID=UPI002A181147|nr:DUF6118 family protein [Acidiphilium sp.]MEE3504617.1 DUF6118 family protein [Acidiphilium acidophilum]
MADEDDQDGAARAFEDMRAEFSVLRRGVEALPGVWEDNRPPDYTPNFVRIEKAISVFERRLAAVEAQPALKRTPEQYAGAIEQAGRGAVVAAVQRLDQAVRDANGLGQTMTTVIGTVRAQRDQRERVIWAAALGLWFGLIVGVAAFNPIVNAVHYVVSAF